MIEKTQAIVLRYAPYSNTSRVVTWLTPDWGKLVTMIKGSQRPKSTFLGQYDLFYTCELLFYVREHNHIHIARECAPQKTRDGLRRDWRASATASYFSDLIARLSPPDAPHSGLYDLLEQALDQLAENTTAIPFVFWFELKLLETLGLSPRFRQCTACNRELVTGERHAHFSQSRGGIVCADCRDRHSGASVPVSPDILGMLTAWQKSGGPQAALNTQCSVTQTDGIEKLLGLFLSYHLDTSLTSREIAMDVLTRKIPE